jgi:hypothetical protein
VYILSHSRPAHEVLHPRLKNIQQAFQQEFAGMTTEETSLEALIAAREQLISTIRSRLDKTISRFLLSFHKLQPEWELLGTPDIRNLPAIRWKLMNVELLQIKKPKKYRTLIGDLEQMLSIANLGLLGKKTLTPART